MKRLILIGLFESQTSKQKIFLFCFVIITSGASILLVGIRALSYMSLPTEMKVAGCGVEIL